MTITYSNGTHPTNETFNPLQVVRDANHHHRVTAPDNAIPPFDITDRKGNVVQSFSDFGSANKYLSEHPNKTLRYRVKPDSED